VQVPPEVLPVMVQVTLLEPDLVAVTVTVPPASAAVTEMVGVLSSVMLSVDDDPLSELVTRSGVAGADGAPKSEAIVTESVVELVDVLPAGSVCVAVMAQVPTARVPSVQVPPVVLPVMVQVTLLEPDLVAVTVTVPPASAAVTEMSGVLSSVLLSVDEEPVSELAIKSGVDGAVGAVVSMVMLSDADATEVLPLESACVAVIVHVPSARVPSVQVPPEVLPVMVQVTLLDPPLVAVTVTVPPASAVVAEMSGVLSSVVLSVEDWPESDAATRSGVPGALGADVSATVVKVKVAVEDSAVTWLPAVSLNADAA